MEDSRGTSDELRAIFNLCDEQKEGYISTQHFTNLIKEHLGGGEEEIVVVVQFLDPDGNGKITFEEFCEGIRQILKIKGESDLPIGAKRLSGSLNYLSEDTLVPEEDNNSNGTQETSEISTYSEYDMMTDEDVGPLINFSSDSQPHQNNSVGQLLDFSTDLSKNSDLKELSLLNVGSNDDDASDLDSAISGKSDFQDQRREVEITDEEEQFEDFGEADDFESGEDLSDIPDRSRIIQRKGKQYRDRRENKLRQSKLSCPRRLSSNAHASNLYNSSTHSDEIFDDIDGNFDELNEKIRKLESQIGLLSEGQLKTDDKHNKLKDENTTLRDRVHQLEEQLRDVEVKSATQLTQEQRRYKEQMARAERERSIEIESLNLRLQHVEKEYQEAKEEAPRLRVELERLRRDKEDLEDKLLESQGAYTSLLEDYKRLQEKYQLRQEEFEHERSVSAQMIEELSKEVDDLRRYKQDAEKWKLHRSSSLSETEGGITKELENEIHRLQEENKALHEVNDDLSAQVMHHRIAEGQSLLNGTRDGQSLAAEIEELSKDELMQALKDQRDVNSALREYVDRVLLSIIENNPSILEIKPTKK